MVICPDAIQSLNNKVVQIGDLNIKFMKPPTDLKNSHIILNTRAPESGRLYIEYFDWGARANFGRMGTIGFLQAGGIVIDIVHKVDVYLEGNLLYPSEWMF